MTLKYWLDGVSNFNKLTFTDLRQILQRAKSRFIIYREYKHFDENEFSDVLIKALSSNKVQSDDLVQYINIFKMVIKKSTFEGKIFQIAKFMKKA